MLLLDDPVSAIGSVGHRAAAKLADQLGIVTVRDLLEHYPRRYEDLGDVLPLEVARIGEPVTLVATILDWSHLTPRSRRRGHRIVISEAKVRDRAGTCFKVTWFNQQWRERRLPPGTVAAFSGRLEKKFGGLRLVMPAVQALGREERDREGPQARAGWEDSVHRRLLAIYPATEALPSWRLAGWIERALSALPPLPDFLPPRLRHQFGLIPLDDAVRAIHAPEHEGQARAARRRLAFDELFTLQAGLQWRRERLRTQAAGLDNAPVAGGLAERFLAALPFRPTRAQRRAFEEIGGDLARHWPMHRLLQGDVGSGKTLVATWTTLCAVDHGRQAAVMAPTEVLAEQHYRTLIDQLAPLGVNVLDSVRVELLTSATTGASRRRILAELLAGEVDLVVGTHALLEEEVRFRDLGVVVVDEQHRFGVHQRMKLKEKGSGEVGAREIPERVGGSCPDVLVMTATPIPRSLALTFFGDLDVTVLDELPPGRHEIVTQLITPAESHRRERLYDFVRSQAAAGYQTYVVCPLVEESDEVGARAAEAEHARLCAEVFPDLRVGLVHGRMRSEDKEAAMAGFRRGDFDVLVTTTVIEVGVDVPTATIMVVEDAERFGISQLHQLRGRVGRGTSRSYCVLFADPQSNEARARLEAVASTSDGFALAETDLQLRGEGHLFGVRQSGAPDFKLVRLARDVELVAETRAAAQKLVAVHPSLRDEEVEALRHEVRRRYHGGLEELEALSAG
ncbi:MAG: ATP-dependent DNA helicase RecG [Actinomycetota bacterium]|nr:ATP-dependent DNA helicase RecG [Actinomycetota bacterium]